MGVKKIMLVALLGLLGGCDSNLDVFGIKLGGNIEDVKKDGLIKKVDVIPSDKHLIYAELSSVPSPDAGSEASYSLQASDGSIVSISANIHDSNGSRYAGIVSFVKGKLGDAIATESDVINEPSVNASVYVCSRTKSCPGVKYAVFRKGTNNALVYYDEKETNVLFSSDAIKDAL
ncbi:hypothetical protein ACWASV_000467 [Serratia marcescens]